MFLVDRIDDSNAMARTIGRLTALGAEKAKNPGMYADGGGLYLRVTKEGTKNWVFRFMLNGRPRWMGLGSLHTIKLAEARARAATCRKQRHDGIDPIEARNNTWGMTFKKCAESYIDMHKAGWRNVKHAAQWAATLETYVYPVIGALAVQAIDTALVMKSLEPIWKLKPETAGRVRGRIEAVLDWATVRGYRRDENPARWRGHLDKLLLARAKVRKVKHHPALPYAEIGEFMSVLRQQEGVAARALEFTVLAAARTGETLGVTWGEIDIDRKVWRIPAERMKAGKEHRIPLSARATEIVRSMKKLVGGEVPADPYVFRGAKRGRPLSNMAFLMLLRRMGRDDLTAHGFRSSFRDWAAERTRFSREAIEASLAHTLGDKTESAYLRTDLFDRRRRLMDEWARFCGAVERKSAGNNNVASAKAALA